MVVGEEYIDQYEKLMRRFYPDKYKDMILDRTAMKWVYVGRRVEQQKEKKIERVEKREIKVVKKLIPCKRVEKVTEKVIIKAPEPIEECKVKEKPKQSNILSEKQKKDRERRRRRNSYNREFKANREIVLIIDNFTCRECGSRDNLHVHHVVNRKDGGTNDINNLITLCARCHAEKHRNEAVYNIMCKGLV